MMKCVVALALAGMVVGCSKKDKTVAPPVQVQTGEVKVSVVPEAPTAEHDLVAQISCAGRRSIAWEKNGTIIDGRTDVVLPRGLLLKGDMVKTVVTCDGKSGSVAVRIANALPEVSGVTLTPEKICKGTDITVTPAGRDADGDAISYSFRWLLNGNEVSASQVLTGLSFSHGDKVVVEVVPTDTQQGKIFQSREVVIPDCPPVFVSVPPAAFTGDLFSYQAKAVDPDGDAIRYSLEPPVKGVTVDTATGVVSWRPADVPAPVTLKIIATDSNGLSAFQEFSIPRIGEAKP